MAKTTSLENGAGDESVPCFDFRGVLCPLNFVRTKIELEKIAVGESIQIRIDPGEPARNVPRSLIAERQEITSTLENDDQSLTLEVLRKH